MPLTTPLENAVHLLVQAIKEENKTPCIHVFTDALTCFPVPLQRKYLDLYEVQIGLNNYRCRHKEDELLTGTSQVILKIRLKHVLDDKRGPGAQVVNVTVEGSFQGEPISLKEGKNSYEAKKINDTWGTIAALILSVLSVPEASNH